MPSRRTAIALGVGLVTGVFSGLLGIGGGLIVIAGLVGWLRTPQHEAHGTSLIAIIPIALVGSVVLWTHDHALVRVPTAVLIGGASIIGAPLGARIAHAASGRLLRRIVGVTALVVAAAMLVKV